MLIEYYFLKTYFMINMLNRKIFKFFHFKYLFRVPISKFCSISGKTLPVTISQNQNKSPYIYIKPNSKVSDLIYKEELFEYFAYNYLNMQEEQIMEILKKLQKYSILETEVKDFKC